MRAFVVALGVCVLVACGSESDTASNEGTGGLSAGGAGKSGSAGKGGSSGWSSGGNAGSGGKSGSSGADAGAGAGGGSAAGASGATSGGAAGGAGCPQQVTETKAPGAVTDDPTVGYQAWANPSYAITSDDSRATSPALPPTRATHRLIASTFGFQIPANAVVEGIEVVIERSQGGLGNAKDSAIRVAKAGAAAPDNPISTDTWPATDTPMTYGGATSLWGTTWTPAEISAADFAVWIRAQNTHATESVNPRVDSLKVTVHYLFDACAP